MGKQTFQQKIANIICENCDRNEVDCHREKIRILNCIMAFRNFYIKTMVEKHKNRPRLPLCHRYHEVNE